MTGLFGRSKPPSEKKVDERKKELRKLVKQKQYEQALKVGNEILEKNPYDQDVLFIVGGIYYMKNKLQTAISYFDRSLEIAQFDTETLLLKANAHFRLGESSKAQQCCEKIQEIDPKNKGVNELLEKIENTKK
jgi:tetratricopeptide (TPR) repeat protein